ncbi:MAG: oxidoreductase [Promethearchaeota archaeon]
MLDLNVLKEPFDYRGIRIQNRFVAQPMERSAATLDGFATPELISDYQELAKGRWGIIIIEAMSVSREFKSRRNQLIIDYKSLKSLRQLVSAVKNVDPNTKIIFQITFPGMVTGAGLPRSTIIPSVHLKDPSVRLLSRDDIKKVSDQHRSAVAVAMDAGADGVDIKACHGYLGVEFLRPINTRQDEFGGPFENRVRFFMEIFDFIRGLKEERCMNNFLVGSRLSVYEAIMGGFGTSGPEDFIEDLSEPIQLIEKMHKKGLDFVNVTAGVPAMMPELTRPSRCAPFTIYTHFRYSKMVKDRLKKLKSGMFVIGSAYSQLRDHLLYHAVKNVRDGVTDFIGLGRQILADPRFPEKIFGGAEDRVNFCVGCNLCAKLLALQRHVGCVKFNEKFKKALKEKEIMT